MPTNDPSGIKAWGKTYAPMLLFGAGVVAWMTRGFGYYTADAEQLRRKAAAEAAMPFGEVVFVKREALEAGGGAPRAVAEGDWVTAQITGWHGATQHNFWSSTFGQSRSVGFQVGEAAGKAHKVLPGIERAALQMSVGERATVAVPPDLAYGGRGKPAWGIQPWDILHFDVVILTASTDMPDHLAAASSPSPSPSPSSPIEAEQPAEDPSAAVDDSPTASPTASAAAAGGPPGAAASAAGAGGGAAPAVDAPLLSELQGLGLGKFAADLAGIGLVSLGDVAFLESVDDLPPSIPLFTRKKLVAWARERRAAPQGPPAGGGGGGGSGGEKSEADQPAEAVEQAGTCSADGGDDTCRG
eukprot:TRINITY_DN22_c2_g1_i2.p1 TRINITY_DN22_c2_g1~~TRINITY_DN22_c2_g1_i2.p1  ORF type:complete len:356 (+),score=118.23 TRINITY_DN22_c2_g1_i2:96-1163(+)